MLPPPSIRDALVEALRKTPARKAILFGSHGRGTASKRSDIDLIIIHDTTKRFLDRFEDFTAIYSALPTYAIDMLVYTPEELERNSDRPFLRRAIAEGVTIYER